MSPYPAPSFPTPGVVPRLTLPLAMALAFATATAAAAAEGARDPVRAEALFRDARAASKAGDHAAACPKFAESLRLDPAAGTALNLAACHERAGRLASAWTAYRTAADQMRPGDDRLAWTHARIAGLEPRLARVVVRSGDAPAGSTLLLDGDPIANARDRADESVARPVDAGQHVAAVRAPGRADRAQTFEIADGEAKRVELEPVDARGARAPMDASQTRGGGWKRGAGWTALGLGGAGLALGAVSGAMTLSSASTVRASCNGANECSPDGLDAAERGRVTSTLSTVGFVAGGALTAVGVYLLVTAPSRATAVAPVLGPGFAGLQATHTF